MRKFDNCFTESILRKESHFNDTTRQARITRRQFGGFLLTARFRRAVSAVAESIIQRRLSNYSPSYEKKKKENYGD